MVLYAILSLTVVRMVPVLAALTGARLDWATNVLVAWFGPRGLASVVFALLALEELGRPVAGPAVAVITITVVISIVAHGATAEPLARRYANRVARAAAGDTGIQPPDVPDRRLIRHATRRGITPHG
jgi:NhaP-type Na+/H+ or K+/H+ antiporter